MKGQVSLEAMFVVAFIIIGLIFALQWHFLKLDDIDFASNQFQAKKVCDTVRESINQAQTSGPGTSVKFELPPTIGGTGYSVLINSVEQGVIVQWEGSAVSCSVVTRNVTNSSHGFFDLKSLVNTARNEDGIVVVNNTG